MSDSDPERPDLEFIDYYGNTSLFALNAIKKHGRFEDMNLLSIACRRSHLVDYMAIFKSVHHVTMVETRFPFAPDESPTPFHLHQKDFFALPSLDIDCVISHAAIHCFNDTRYGNAHSEKGSQKPYQAAAKLREIVGDKKLPVVVSIAVNRDEAGMDDNTHLAHDKFIASFQNAGFALQEYFFDYLCGLPRKPEYFNPEFRRSKVLPEPTGSRWHFVAGNYYFL